MVVSPSDNNVSTSHEATSNSQLVDRHDGEPASLNNKQQTDTPGVCRFTNMFIARGISEQQA